jgi:hypothetical protein
MPMPKDFTKELDQCSVRARECEEQAKLAPNDQTRKELLRARDRWVKMERGYREAQAFIQDAASHKQTSQ